MQLGILLLAKKIVSLMANQPNQTFNQKQVILKDGSSTIN